jgi:hypothetical protein
MVFALVAGLSGAAEIFVFGLQVMCLALTGVWPVAFRRMFARSNGTQDDSRGAPGRGPPAR